MTTFNFNAIKRSYMTVVLPDEEQTTLHVGVPKKKTILRFSELQQEMTKDRAIDGLHEIMSDILSCNRENITVTPEQAAEWFEYEDMVEFFKVFSKFIKLETDRKN